MLPPPTPHPPTNPPIHKHREGREKMEACLGTLGPKE